MDKNLKKLEFDKIIEKAKNYCSTNEAKLLYENITFYKDPEIIKTEIKKVAECKYLIENYNFPDLNIKNIKERLLQATKTNIYLEAEEFFNILILIQKTKEVISFLKNTDYSEKIPHLKVITKNIKIYPYITERIKRIIDNRGEIKDTASKKLKEIRLQIDIKTQEALSIVKSVFQYAKKNGYVEENNQIVIRNGRLLIPIIAQYKNKIRGIIVDRSETGKTLYIEPYKTVEIQNIIDDLRYEEKKEIRKILFDLTQDLREYFPEIIQYQNFLNSLDFIKSKALLAIELNAQEPIIENQPYIKLINARHPLLLINYKKQNKKVVPLSMEISEKQPILLISGPNAGGKSVALKTIGLLQTMIQTGFMVSASAKSIFGIFDNIFVDIGDDQSIENDLSTYSSHLINQKNILEHATEKSLILIDEFGTGTDPTLGSAIAQAILQEFKKRNFKAVITTHYSNLKYFAAETEGVENAAMLFDNINLKPLYELNIGQPGSSYTFEIAQNIGLDKQIIENAKKIVGQQQIDFETIIAKIQQERRQIQKEREQLAKIKKELKEKVIAYRQEYEKILKEKKAIITQTQQEAEKILNDANKLIENTIREIKTHKAEKEITKKIRKNFTEQKQKIKEKLEKTQNKVIQQIQKIPNKKKKTQRKTIKEGDYVKIKNQQIKGEVIQIKDNTAMIEAGSLRLYVPLEKLELTQKDKQHEKVKVNVNISEKPNSPFLNIDVRGLRAEDALKKVAKFIDNALISETQEIRILHGTGDGILRKTIRSYLAKLDFIEYFGDADVRQGGAGITVIKFKNK